MFPVEAKVGEIAAALARNRTVVLSAPPGSGKTTCVPPALLDAPWLGGRKIVMLEPRRIAARSCAGFIAGKLGEQVGNTVGYQVRLERRVSSRTRLEIVTEGLLSQRIIADPELSDTGLVIFDEFHERSLACDLSFSLALDVRRALRPDLRIMVMSATLDVNAIAAHLGDADAICAEGRMFPVETVYLGNVSIPAAVAKARANTDGDILCFLPGEGEIRRAAAQIPDALPLYGALERDAQDRVFDVGGPRKVILATSIAETSVTIPGVTCVIDSGLMRIPRFSPASGMTGLVTLPLTRDRAEQRRGRAGRVRPGVCYRLWTAAEDLSRPERMQPEILDADIAALVLSSAAWGALRRDDLPWLTPPPVSAWDRSVELLRLLGALDDRGQLTSRGRAMAKLPMHPRLARMLLDAAGDSLETASLLAAIVEEDSRSREVDVRRKLDIVRETPNDPESHRLLRLARRFADAVRGGSDKCQPAGRQGEGQGWISEGSLLARAYPDRIARNRGNGSFQMVCGRGAFVESSDPLAKAPYIVCCRLDDRTGDARVFQGAPICEEEIEELFRDRMTQTLRCDWDRANDRVRCAVCRRLGAMTLRECPVANRSDPEMAEKIAAAMMEGVVIKGLANLPCWTPAALQLRNRIAFVARHDDSWQKPTDETLLSVMPPFLNGMVKWRDLEKMDIVMLLDAVIALGGHDRRQLDRLAPQRIEVPSGSRIIVHYEGDEPTAAVRLQECFGLTQTPYVMDGKVPVVMTLLSPAQRPIQITKDLAGFWRGAYQLVRKDMRGRYPKHNWPEDPLTAKAGNSLKSRSSGK